MSDKKNSIRVKDLNESSRPRERLVSEGAQALSSGELLAILLRVGVQGTNAVELGNQILARFGSLSAIQKADFADLCEMNGVGIAKAAQIKAAVELCSRLAREHLDLNPVISTPEEAIALVGYELRGKEQEELWVVLLNTRNRIIGKDRLYKGSLNSSSVRIGEVFKMAIRNNAKSIILFHNHPSGDANESPEDVNLTRSVIEAGKLMDVDVLDHIIIAGSEHVSIRKNHPSLWMG